MKTHVIVSAAALFLLATSARAQQADNLATSFAAAEEEIGQSIGQAAMAGPSLFVTAKGRAKLPAPIADSYFVTITGKDPSAVAAVKARDRRIVDIMAVARRLGVEPEVGETGITLEVDPDAQQRLVEQQTAQFRAQAQLNVHGPIQPIPPPPKIFIATTSLRFRTPSTANLAAFLDALHAAGVDEFSRGPGTRNVPFLPQTSEFMGFGSTETLNPALWQTAGEDALRNAQVQAQALALAAGLKLGPAHQITVLTRSLENGAATESVAVRFGLADPFR